MQIFIPYADPLLSLKTLDRRRLNNQINEAEIIIRALNGAKAWGRHPIVRMYRGYVLWVEWYRRLAIAVYHQAAPQIAELLESEPTRPSFIGFEPLHLSHRRRLYTKDEIAYSEFISDGRSDCNMYIVENEILTYRNGKLINIAPYHDPHEQAREKKQLIKK